LESNAGETFNVGYAVDPSRWDEESTLFVTAGYKNFFEEWNTVIPKNYAGLTFENIDLTVDVTPTYITSLVPGVDPWDFQQQSIQQGFDLSRWEGSELPSGHYLHWAVDEQIFGRFTQQNGPSIQFSEHDAATNIAPAPDWDPEKWVSPEARPAPQLSIQR